MIAVKPIKIKRSYKESTKNILKKIRPYSHDVNTYTIVINVKEDNPTYIQYYTIRWIKRIPFNIEVSGYMRDEFISEVIEALKLADKEVVFLIETYY